MGIVFNILQKHIFHFIFLDTFLFFFYSRKFIVFCMNFFYNYFRIFTIFSIFFITFHNLYMHLYPYIYINVDLLILIHTVHAYISVFFFFINYVKLSVLILTSITRPPQPAPNPPLNGLLQPLHFAYISHFSGFTTSLPFTHFHTRFSPVWTSRPF